jgi:hypothetical protein
MTMNTSKTVAAAIGSLLLASAAFAQTFTPNDIKYRDSGEKPATGRSGDATIEAVALLGKNGSTELTVTSNGSIDKVQVKVGEVTTNHNGSAGSTFTTTMTGLRRRDSFAVQANVSGPDAARTGVVSANPVVRMRPELTMQWVEAPPHAVAGVPVHITADVSERFRDTGARTNCVLLQNGVEIDRVENLWVDAGGMVACEFAHIFPPGSGTVSLTVGLTGTVPADYDASRDFSRPFEIQVYDRMADVEQWHASAYDSHFSSRLYSRSGYGESESITDGHYAETLFHATFRTTQPNVESLRASFRVMTDDRFLASSPDVWFDYQPKQDYGWMTLQCALAELGERQNYVRSCRVTTPDEGQYTTFHFNFSTGDVTYLSRGWSSAYLGGSPTSVWSWNNRDVFGSGTKLGDTVSYDIQLSDGTNFWYANPTITLTTTTKSDESPLTCFGEVPYETCYASSSSSTVKQGFVSFTR